MTASYYKNNMQKQRTTSEELGVFLSPVIVSVYLFVFLSVFFSLQNDFQSRLNHVKMPSLHQRRCRCRRRLRRPFGLGMAAFLTSRRNYKD
jgi:hypothetical protein